jgi:hypothetical protein
MDIEAAFAAFDEVVRITASASSVTQGMNSLLDYISQVQPDEVWNKLRSLNYQADISALRDWLVGVLTNDPPPPNVKVYWFGIFNPVIDDEVLCGFYVSGSPKDCTPDTLDWACWTDGTYLPQARYAPSAVLYDIYRAIQNRKGGALLGEYTLCLGYVCLAVAEIVRSLDARLFLGTSEERPVVVGFDDGDSILLGTIRLTGWAPVVPPAP